MSVGPAKPYVGLERFEEGDRRIYFGREDDCKDLVSHALAYRMTVVCAPSGYGKSSLVRAGLCPALKEETGVTVRVEDNWNGQIPACLAPSEKGADSVRPTRAVIILDQFEDAFRDKLPEGFADRIGKALRRLIDDGFHHTNLVICIREDSLAFLNRLRPGLPKIFSNVFPLRPVKREGAERALKGPLELFPGASMSGDLIDAIITACSSADGVVQLPFLQLAADRVWMVAREPRLMTVEDFEQAGGNSMFANHLNQAVASMSGSDRKVITRIFDRIATPSGHKLSYAVGDLHEVIKYPAERIQAIVNTLCDKRILMELSGGASGAPSRYELIHDSLARPALQWVHAADRRRKKWLGGWSIAAFVLGLALAVKAWLFYVEGQQQREETIKARDHADKVLASIKNEIEKRKDQAFRALDAGNTNMAQEHMRFVVGLEKVLPMLTPPASEGGEKIRRREK